MNKACTRKAAFVFLIRVSLFLAEYFYVPFAVIPTAVADAELPPPANLLAVCSPDSTHAALSWDAVPGANGYGLAVNDPANDGTSCIGGWYCPNTDDILTALGTNSYNASVIAGTNYDWWVVSTSSTTPNSTGVASHFTCAPDTLTVAPTSGIAPLAVTFTGVVNASGSCNSSAFTLSYQGAAQQIDIPAGECKPHPYSYTYTYNVPNNYRSELYSGTIDQAGKHETPRLVTGPLVQVTRDWVSISSPASGPSPLTVTFSGTLNAAGSCDEIDYVLDFGDQIKTPIRVPAGECEPHPYSVAHVYQSSSTARFYRGSYNSIFIDQKPPLASIGGGTVFVTPTNAPLPSVDPQYPMDPNVVFPDTSSILPSGVTYIDTVPNTTDLAQMAAAYIKGAVNTSDPLHYYAPFGAVLGKGSPLYLDCPGYPGVATSTSCLSLAGGEPNWGKVMLGLAKAREMTGYDRSDADGSVTRQLAMIRNMIDYGVNTYLYLDALGQSIYTVGTAFVPVSAAMQALTAEWEQHHTQALSDALHQFVLLHSDALASTTDPQGKIFDAFYNYPPNFNYEGWTPDPNHPCDGTNQQHPYPCDTHEGYFGNFWIPYIQGRALRALEEWYLDSGDSSALDMSNQLSAYLRNYNGGSLWQNPDPSRFPSEPGMFAGHMHAWAQAQMGFLLQAQVLQKIGGSDNLSLASNEIALVNRGYNFLKGRTRAGLVGNFGDSGQTGNMVTIGIQLSELGTADYYDEIEAWTRNQLVESQIDDAFASYALRSDNGAPDKVKGLFNPDATHIFAVPTLSFDFSTDEPSNTFRGLYEVWNHIIDIKGSNAQVNFLLNRAGIYFDVKSDIPYRGKVEIDTKQSLGDITTLQIHIPNWTDNGKVAVAVKNSDGSQTPLFWNWGGPYGNYAQISNIKPNTAYVITFPIVISNVTVYEMRDMNTMWYEGSYPSDPINDSFEHISSYTGIFRGNTLVGLQESDPRTKCGAPPNATCIPRYREQWRKDLLALGNTETAPPTMSVTRFVYGVSAGAKISH